MELTKLQRDYLIWCLKGQASTAGISKPFILELMALLQQNEDILGWSSLMEEIRKVSQAD